jgi:hypothetical protein
MKGVSKMGNLLGVDDNAARDITTNAAAVPVAPAAAAALPAGWEVLFDDRGIIYYGNPEARTTQCATPNVISDFAFQTERIPQV